MSTDSHQGRRISVLLLKQLVFERNPFALGVGMREVAECLQHFWELRVVGREFIDHVRRHHRDDRSDNELMLFELAELLGQDLFRNFRNGTFERRETRIPMIDVPENAQLPLAAQNGVVKLQCATVFRFQVQHSSRYSFLNLWVCWRAKSARLSVLVLPERSMAGFSPPWYREKSNKLLQKFNGIFLKRGLLSGRIVVLCRPKTTLSRESTRFFLSYLFVGTPKFVRYCFSFPAPLKFMPQQGTT